MSDGTPAKTVWPTLRYADAPAAIEFLKKAFGFEERIVVPGPNPETDVAHCELAWPEGGGVMLGSAQNITGDWPGLCVGGIAVYVVTDRPDELFAQAEAEGAEVAMGLHDTDFGSRTFTVRDPEGNYWTLGTYRGES